MYHLIVSEPYKMVVDINCDWFQLLKLCNMFTDLGCNVSVHFNYNENYKK